MTTRERMLSVYKNIVPDKFPVGIYSKYLPRGFDERELRNKGIGIIEYYPVVSMLAPPWHYNSGFISQVKNVDLDIRYTWDQGRLFERRTYKTPVGEIYEVMSQSVGAGSEFIKEYYIKSTKDYRVMKYIVENTIIRSNESQILKKKKELGEDGVLLGRIDRSPYQKTLIELAGAEQFFVDLNTDPDPVVELLSTMDKKMDEVFDMVLNLEVDAVWQPENITSDMTPPKNFKAYCLPFYNKRGKLLRQAEKPYILHLDGKLKALKDLINIAEFDVIESMSLTRIGGDYDLTEARNNFPGKIIIPNFPANLCSEDDKTIELFLQNFKEEVGTTIPVMLQVSEDIPDEHWSRILKILSEV